jgi:D-ribose pyranose/furanose isomerase RbsD
MRGFTVCEGCCTEDDAILCGMDVPVPGSWSAEDVAFWTGTPHYQPWKDVAAFFRESGKNG